MRSGYSEFQWNVGFNDQKPLREVLNDRSMCVLSAGKGGTKVQIVTSEYFLELGRPIDFNLLWMFHKVCLCLP